MPTKGSVCLLLGGCVPTSGWLLLGGCLPTYGLCLLGGLPTSGGVPYTPPPRTDHVTDHTSGMDHTPRQTTPSPPGQTTNPPPPAGWPTPPSGTDTPRWTTHPRTQHGPETESDIIHPLPCGQTNTCENIAFPCGR